MVEGARLESVYTGNRIAGSKSRSLRQKKEEKEKRIKSSPLNMSKALARRTKSLSSRQRSPTSSDPPSRELDECAFSTASRRTKRPSPRCSASSIATSVTLRQCRRVSGLSGSGGAQHRHRPRAEHDALGHAVATAHPVQPGRRVAARNRAAELLMVRYCQRQHLRLRARKPLVRKHRSPVCRANDRLFQRGLIVVPGTGWSVPRGFFVDVFRRDRPRPWRSSWRAVS